MKIIGNRVLVSQVIAPQSGTGFTTVEVQNDFIYKGKIEQVGSGLIELINGTHVEVGNIILFARNSPDTQDIEIEGKKLKVVSYPDIIAIL